MPKVFRHLFLGLYLLSLGLYSWWSFGLTAPNLFFSSWQPYVDFQWFMWNVLFENKQNLVYFYLGTSPCIWLSYACLVWQKKTIKSFKVILFSLLLVMIPLLLANTALSYDVFNYIFNAKMVLVYQANPHVQVALDFAQDPWTRFMHNTHTPAPYGYGWTAISLLPSALGLQKFLPTWLLFKAMSIISILGLVATYWWLHTKRKIQLNWPMLWLVIINPLLLVEVVGNAHNDLWMMVPALLSFGLVWQPSNKRFKYQTVLISAILLLVSIQIKLASLVLVPLWLLLIIPSQQDFFKATHHWAPFLAAGLFFVPLFTPRSQQFHPWYFSWVLVWLPLIPWYSLQLKNKLLVSLNRSARILVQILVPSWILLSISSWLRYLPWLWSGEYSASVVTLQRAITWGPFFVCLLVVSLWVVSKAIIKNMESDAQ